jgi:SAM-dependent methyltransferase
MCNLRPLTARAITEKATDGTISASRLDTKVDEPLMSIDTEALEIIRCPVTKQRLFPHGDSEVHTADGQYRYAVIHGVFVLMPDRTNTDWTEEKEDVKRFYDSFGWEQTADGEFADTALFVNSSPVPRRYTRRCNLRINHFLPKSGRYLLDAGSGPIPHAEYLTFHEGYSRRICVDFSLTALLQAQRKLGNRGIYILGDLTNLPVADGAVDAAVCCHVLYHVPAQQQATAMEQLARVLQPGGKAIVVYRWENSPLAWRIGRCFELLKRVNPGGAADRNEELRAAALPLYFHPHSKEWLMSGRWSFDFDLACFRLIDNFMMGKYVGEGLLWKIVTTMLFYWQVLMPRFTGLHGLYPLIIIRK